MFVPRTMKLQLFSPEVSVRTSMADYKKEEWLINLPLYAIDQIKAETNA